MVEQTLTRDRSRIDSFLSVLDRESFDSWAERVQRSGEVPISEIEQLKSRLTHQAEARRHLAPVPATECHPTFGLPVAVQQVATQTRRTIADVDEDTFTVWVLGEENQFDDSRDASFVLLSRSGTIQFDSHFSKLPDDSLDVQRPARSLQSQRRRFDRYPARIPAYIVRLRGDVTPVEVTITELSGGGATLTDLTGLFGEGQIPHLSFNAGGKSYKVTGRVVRADDGALHIRFEAMRDQERLEIAASVAVIEPAYL